MSSGDVKSFRDLEVWRLSIELTVSIYDVTRSFPKYETYALSTQMQRASVSIASNIAEGHVRSHTAEFVQFLSIARGSAAELETQAIIAGKLGYLTPDATGELVAKIDRISKMIWALQNTLRK